MSPSDEAVEFFGKLCAKYTGDADLTFLGMYQRLGVELCISVSNIARGQNEYLHVNTSPNLPIKYAIRASMSLPILWRPVDIFKNGDKYIDGGVFK